MIGIRTELLEGRTHVVVPVVMLRVGVWNGSAGPTYYPAEAIEASVPHWNGKPVVVYHPDIYGTHYAGSPLTFNRQKVGSVFDTKFERGQLKANCWIDTVRASEVDYRIMQHINAGKVMEVSTGLTIYGPEKAGIWNGKKYEISGDWLLPDHLALLPDQKGACSVADGAGLCRNANGGLGGVDYLGASHAVAAGLFGVPRGSDETPYIPPTIDFLKR